MRVLLLFSVLLLTRTFTSGQELINLAGEWSFKLDPENKGLDEGWYRNTSFYNIIRLPGCLQEQGFGEISNIETKWWGGETLYGWFLASPWLKKYQSDGNFKTQAWLIPDRHYLGAAWYAIEVDIPETWEGKHLTLFLERCHWETKLWVDGEYMGDNLSLAAPHIYNLSSIKPGKHVVVLRVDNSEIIKIGKMPHSVSEQTAGTWNGTVGKLELRAEASVWIENFQIYPDIDNNKVKVKGNIVNMNPQKQGKWKINVNVAEHNSENNHTLPTIQVEGILGETSNSAFEFEYNMGDEVKLWDEFNPNLYIMKLSLRADIDGKTYQNRKEEVFGMRKFEAVGRQFYVNGIKTFLRGNVDCAVFPKTGYAPMDVDSWRKVWRTYKKFGLNMARFHSWCPPKAAFIAADEIGIYLAPEVGEWTYIKSQEQFDFLRREALRILKTYGNHCSFIQMGLGNESSGDKKFFYELIAQWKKTDSRHLYTIKANSRGNPKNIDFEVARGVGKPLLKLRYQGGWPPAPMNTEFHKQAPQTNIDWNQGVASRKIPLIQHETAQICAYPNLMKEISKYDGYLNPTYLEIAMEQLGERGMLNQLPDFVEASGKWQIELTKEEFEAAYRTKELAGFHWLSLADFTGQNTAPVGFVDAFYDVKPYVDASKVRRWIAPTVLLARMKKRVYTSKDLFKAGIEVSHYGKEKQLLEVTARLKTSDGVVLKKWEFTEKEFLQGSAQEIGQISFPLETITKPTKLILELESEENHLFNEWNLWVFPDIETTTIPKSIIVAKEWNSTIEKKLKKGKTVLLLPQKGSLKGQLPICFTNYYWTSFGENRGQSSAAGVLIKNEHPIFKNFPTENHTNWQWWDLLTHCQPMILDSYDNKYSWPKGFKPVVQPIDSWKINRKLALVVEVRVGKGKLLICSIDIEKDLNNRPATKQFRQGLIEYILSDSFNPETEVSVEMIQELFNVKSIEKNEGDSNLPSDG